MDAVCTYRPDPSGLELDRKKLYWELRHETQDVTQLGFFTLDKDSLYVNGERPKAATAENPPLRGGVALSPVCRRPLCESSPT